MSEEQSGLTVGVRAIGLFERSESYQEGLAELYSEYGRSLYRYALALTSSPQDAEDAVQEVFVRIARHWTRFPRVRNVRSYLFMATRNAAYNALRSRRRKEQVEAAVSDWTAGGHVQEDQAVSDRAIAMRQAFCELPTEQREVLALKVVHEMTFKEIAATVGASINTVAGRYRYGVERLRKTLEDKDDG